MFEIGWPLLRAIALVICVIVAIYLLVRIWHDTFLRSFFGLLMMSISIGVCGLTIANIFIPEMRLEWMTPMNALVIIIASVATFLFGRFAFRSGEKEDEEKNGSIL